MTKFNESAEQKLNQRIVIYMNSKLFVDVQANVFQTISKIHAALVSCVQTNSIQAACFFQPSHPHYHFYRKIFMYLIFTQLRIIRCLDTNVFQVKSNCPCPPSESIDSINFVIDFALAAAAIIGVVHYPNNKPQLSPIWSLKQREVIIDFEVIVQ